MSNQFAMVYVARHGETAWRLTGQHTGRTDMPLTENGERVAGRLQERLRGLTFAKVFASPLQRVRRTCELASFGGVAEIDPDLVEWDYGQYEGRSAVDILAQRPDWELFRDRCPRGEMPEEVAARADWVVNRIRAVPRCAPFFERAFHSRSCVKLVGRRTDDPQSKFSSEHGKLKRPRI